MNYSSLSDWVCLSVLHASVVEYRCMHASPLSKYTYNILFSIKIFKAFFPVITTFYGYWLKNLLLQSNAVSIVCRCLLALLTCEDYGNQWWRMELLFIVWGLPQAWSERLLLGWKNVDKSTNYFKAWMCGRLAISITCYARDIVTFHKTYLFNATYSITYVLTVVIVLFNAYSFWCSCAFSMCVVTLWHVFLIHVRR